MNLELLTDEDLAEMIIDNAFPEQSQREKALVTVSGDRLKLAESICALVTAQEILKNYGPIKT